MTDMRSMKAGGVSILLIGALLFIGALLATPGLARQASPPPPPAQSPQTISVQVPPAPSEPPLPAGPAPDLNLVFTAQVAGWIEPCG